MQYRYQSEGKIYELSIERQGEMYRAILDGQTYELEILDSNPDSSICYSPAGSACIGLMKAIANGCRWTDARMFWNAPLYSEPPGRVNNLPEAKFEPPCLSSPGNSGY